MITPMLDPAVYGRAEQLMWMNRRKLVEGGEVRPRWVGKGERFWYRLDAAAGHRFVVVDPVAGSREPAFDHQRLAQVLGAASGSPADPAALPFIAIELSDGVLQFDTAEGHWRCPLDSYVCEKLGDHKAPGPSEVRSPDKSRAAFLREHDLWVRVFATGEETRLTFDGTADRAYGSNPDCFNFGTLMRRFGLPHLPPFVAWSPDSKRLLSHCTDQRDVAVIHLVESAPASGGRPVSHAYRYAMPGEEAVPRAELLVFEVEAGTAVPAKTEPLLMPLASPLMFKQAWWARDGSAVYYLDQPRDLKALRLRRLDPVTGEVRTLVEETGEPRVETSQFAGRPPIVRVLSDEPAALRQEGLGPAGGRTAPDGGGRSSGVLWGSQRDGWGHLYLYDGSSGELRGQLTSGEWVVQEILHVDEDARVVYFTASGLVAADPYREQVCRVGLDGTGFARLDDDDLHHAVTVPENEGYFVDSASTVDTPPVISVRGWDGSVLVELERSDISRLLATGWTPPERFCVKAADGETDIYGVIYLPADFDPGRRYPVIDHPYPGPQHNRVRPTFDPHVYGGMAEPIAALGFVVVAVDGRGTPGRSKAFHDLSYGRLGDAGSLEDHVAALRQLAETRPWMDLDRVGICGISAGGFATVRALCTYPGFYKVGVAEAGNHDNRTYQLSMGETYDGPYDEQTYARSANVEIADRLQGKLLLIHGEMDDNVHPQQTLRLVDRLIAANKDFELLIVPGAEHLGVGYEHYITRRRWDFLVRHLMGAEPPVGYRIAESPLDFETLSDLLG